MASGVTLQESEQKKPDGFFPKLYENVCKTMSENDLNIMPDLKDNNEKLIRWVMAKKYRKDYSVVKLAK